MSSVENLEFVEMSMEMVAKDQLLDAASSSSSEDDAGGNVSSSDSDKLHIGDKETKRVKNWRNILIVVLVLTAGAICAGTYLFVHDEVDNDYEISFALFGNSIETTLGKYFENIDDELRNLGDTISGGSDAEHPFPFVTVNHFETHGAHVLKRSLMEAITYAPLVDASQREAWEEFSVQHQGWIEDSRRIFLGRHTGVPPVYLPGGISPFIYRHRDNIFTEPSPANQTYAPSWYLSPPPFNPAAVNFDVFSESDYQAIIRHAILAAGSVLSPVMDVERFSSHQVSDADHFHYHQQFSNIAAEASIGYDYPHSLVAHPVFETFRNEKVVGILVGSIAWDAYLADLLPDGVNGVVCVLQSVCGEGHVRHFTYELNGKEPMYIGEGDLHDHAFDDLVRRIQVFANAISVDNDDNSSCTYSVALYPSRTFVETYETNVAIVATITVGATFIIVALIFVGYDCMVHRRNQMVTAAAERAHAVVSSLFPAAVRDRLIQEETSRRVKTESPVAAQTPKQESQKISNNSLPIADLFPEVTILFADIVGFTAWSSMREPAQVFVLLETLYSEFDEIARKRGVFKIETIGDCYVAAVGVPKPNDDHAIVMCRFARDCVQSFGRLVKDLEVSLGPDTAELGLRVGIHSGPVTGGVLRGDRARFQLFGDSMNTTSRIESNGARDKIHLSEETANLLIEAGKRNWVIPREDKILAKGKGALQTYWLKNRIRGGSTESDSDNLSSPAEEDSADADEVQRQRQRQRLADRKQRLIDWNVDLLLSLLKKILVRRALTANRSQVRRSISTDFEGTGTPLDDVVEIVSLPEFDANAHTQSLNEDEVNVSEAAIDQLRSFVSNIAAMYNENAFHNFEHASHVTMSVTKLMSRIVAPTGLLGTCEEEDIAATLHDHTYGITSDPLTQFACIFSALIHDVDHQGVPNTQLVKEKAPVALVYQTSPAEQNSIELAWSLFMDDEMNDMRNAICGTPDEFSRFRQLVVNAVLATDIMDKNLKASRNARWEAAFNDECTDENPRDTVNRKATIVIEHLIQASDVAHTMQHWHIYRKWNERFFLECYDAYRNGRAPSDPSVNWYKGEIGFFDFYIIPLAKKLKDCGVFGVSSDEYLNYATLNREEWEIRGQEVVATMLETAEKEWIEKEARRERAVRRRSQK